MACIIKPKFHMDSFLPPSVRKSLEIKNSWFIEEVRLGLGLFWYHRICSGWGIEFGGKFNYSN